MAMPPLPLPADPNPYRVTSSRLLFDSPWIRLREDLFAHSGGSEGRYPVCGFKRSACGVLALDEADRVILVGQWRYPLEAYSWEIVEGGGEEHESPFETIQRELAEEAGLQAQVWEPLAFFHPSNSSTDEEAFLFLATGLSPAPAHHVPDMEEVLAVHSEPLEACIQRVLQGEITDSLSVVALLALQARRAGIQGPMDPALTERFFQRLETHPSKGRARWSEVHP